MCHKRVKHQWYYVLNDQVTFINIHTWHWHVGICTALLPLQRNVLSFHPRLSKGRWLSDCFITSCTHHTALIPSGDFNTTLSFHATFSFSLRSTSRSGFGPAPACTRSMHCRWCTEMLKDEPLASCPPTAVLCVEGASGSQSPVTFNL